MKIHFIYAWYDLYVGAYWNSKKRRLYFMVMGLGLYVEVPVYYEIYSPRCGAAIGACTQKGAEQALRDEPGCVLNRISRQEFEKFE
jgi:hypothetical protein